jgi:MoaA/NifB/PqqE/SkfB family radical SAM enzyme
VTLVEQLKKPDYNAPLESWTVKLVTEGANGHSYNIVAYGDFFWGVHWAEGGFNVERFLDGQALAPILIGNSAEEVACGLDLMFPSREPGIHPPENIALFTQEEVNNLFRFREEKRRQTLLGINHSPAFKNTLISRSNLFEEGDGRPITLICPAPSRACNYRCEYCYHHEHGFDKNRAEMEIWEKAILTAVERIPRPLKFSMGTMGEPLFTPAWREVVYKILDYDHVQLVAFVSNLSHDLEDFFARVDGRRIGVMASLHPTEFKDHDRDLAIFLERISQLKELGVSIVVSQVLTPDCLENFNWYREMIKARGIPVAGHILRGPYRGKMYPEAYSEEEIAKARSCCDDAPFIYDYMSHALNPFGNRCTSGRYGFFMEYDGNVYNCHFARQKMGSIFDPVLWVRDENGFCTSQVCECQTTIGFQEKIDSQFITKNSLHHFEKRS